MGLNSGRLKDAVTQAQLDTVEEQLSAVADLLAAITIEEGEEWV